MTSLTNCQSHLSDTLSKPGAAIWLCHVKLLRVVHSLHGPRTNLWHHTHKPSSRAIRERGKQRQHSNAQSIIQSTTRCIM